MRYFFEWPFLVGELRIKSEALNLLARQLEQCNKEKIEYKELSNKCFDLGCNWCNKNAKNSCYECRQGFFLFQNSCFTSCPINHYADIFKKKCFPINTQNQSK